MKVQIYGDSLMKAILVDENYKYKPSSKALLDKLKQDTGIDTINHAHFGYTSTRGKEVLQRDLTRGLDCQAALLEFGGNDCDHNWSKVAAEPNGEHLPNTPLRSFLETLRSMVLALQTVGVQPILMTLPPLDAQKYLEFIGHRGSNTQSILSWLGDVQMIYRWQELYSNGIAQLASQMHLPLVDVRSCFLSRRDYGSLIARDGIHLTGAGYELIFGQLQQTLLYLA